MKSRWMCLAALLLLATAATAQYRTALPGYRYKFPQDHFNHPDFQTEWWYYTGNVKSADGHRFGFELTFFRLGVDRDVHAAGAWEVRDLYLAHLALSDLDGGKFLHAERANRAGPGIAGVSEVERRVWNGNWQASWRGDEQVLQAIDDRFALHFTLRSAKPPVIHGENGVSQKAEGAGHASHYISFTRLDTEGEIDLGGTKFQVAGTAWMDHEFFTHQLEAEQVGWDWLSIQLQDNTELMLFHIRRKDGGIDPFSAGTFVDAHGNSMHLRKDEFTLEPAGSVWTSPTTGAAYPLRWKISIPKLEIALESSTALPSQELASSSGLVPAYWEGAVIFTGAKGGLPISSVGYLEMTGYDRALGAPRQK
jgi:predicted secreted hydrolase